MIIKIKKTRPNHSNDMYMWESLLSLVKLHLQNNKLGTQILRILKLSLQAKFPTIPIASTINSRLVWGGGKYFPY